MTQYFQTSENELQSICLESTDGSITEWLIPIHSKGYELHFIMAVGKTKSHYYYTIYDKISGVVIEKHPKQRPRGYQVEKKR